MFLWQFFCYKEIEMKGTNMAEEREELLKRGKKRAMHLLEKKDYSRKELDDKLQK